MTYAPGDTVVREDGKPGKWLVQSVTPTGLVFFKGYRGPYTATDFRKEQPK